MRSGHVVNRRRAGNGTIERQRGSAVAGVAAAIAVGTVHGMSAAAIRRARASGVVWLLTVALVSTVQAPVAGARDPGQRQQTSTQPSERDRHGAQQLGAREDRARRRV
jgi:hypothetical protein